MVEAMPKDNPQECVKQLRAFDFAPDDDGGPEYFDKEMAGVPDNSFSELSVLNQEGKISDDVYDEFMDGEYDQGKAEDDRIKAAKAAHTVTRP